ncbi:amino acid/amide ABC transporter membrane protein 1, HAAT family [Roseovarius pacificus]|uniref:Amino acid/amide ABC transporter membrane protein 1, HAAT family n=1 Tax=Roseovarius pacificus TaxID=337701 RepID=A0A1M7I9P5_9RHOB|nr:urea ABC transporter permease subunit UrtB [Roseovarius pacificus]GGO61346.1 branched-chain amino acid ABC transporter permease [Roseovarius pacificus]SHM37415.1 amino acid/amide ABC transporter membrane protein 1, HAAT family [Roseovarius pacificus]
MLRVVFAALMLLFLPLSATAQDFQTLLQVHKDEIAKPSRRSVGPVLAELVASGHPALPAFLEAWQGKNVYQRLSDGLFFYIEDHGDTITLLDIETRNVSAQNVAAGTLDQIKPNGGVRRAIGEALVQFRLSAPDPAQRREALDAISRNLDPSQLGPLQASIADEPDAVLRLRKERLANYLIARFGDTSEARVAAIENLSDDLSVDGRAVLSQILRTRLTAAQNLPDDANVARILTPGDENLSRSAAYDMLVAQAGLPPIVTDQDVLKTIEANIDGGRSGGVALAAMTSWDMRYRTYDTLADQGLAPPRVTDLDAILANWTFAELYEETDTAVTTAATRIQESVATRVAFSQTVDIGLDAVSLASIYFLAAIGLAITFGVMGVINMAHGEFIMMGAYTGYVVQLFIPDYTLSLIVALPLSFAVTFAAGVAMERLVIRWLYHRPLETLLATFGISIALQQLAKNIFGTQARPLTSPGWLDGAWMINDVIQIAYIRIAIFVLAVLFLGLLLFVLKKTRLGLEVRAVTQNPRMASSMGINPDKINMLTFGLGSGIAGIAGVAIGLYAKVTSEMGSDYIVQSFMTVVVGGVGNVWGTLAGAGLIGVLQKWIEWLNPSNTLAAQTYMILFIILFIQFRPKGIVALKGRAAGD